MRKNICTPEKLLCRGYRFTIGDYSNKVHGFLYRNVEYRGKHFVADNVATIHRRAIRWARKQEKNDKGRVC